MNDSILDDVSLQDSNISGRNKFMTPQPSFRKIDVSVQNLDSQNSRPKLGFSNPFDRSQKIDLTKNNLDKKLKLLKTGGELNRSNRSNLKNKKTENDDKIDESYLMA